MKCLKCKKTNYVTKKIEDSVELDGGPTVVVSGIQCLVCPKCGDVLMDASTSAKRTQLVLAALVQAYSENLQIPGRVAKWMRKAINLSATEWAKEAGGIDPSAFSQAAIRNTSVDRYSSLILLCKTVAFISGSPKAEHLIQETHQVASLIDEKLLKAVKIA